MLNSGININDLNVIDYRVDKYNIYHVYFLDTDDNRYRYFLSGNEFEKWVFHNLNKLIPDLLKESVLEILQTNKHNFNFTLDLDSLYPR